ncbi:MAG: biotin--[Treponema sp.]|nr:biotin--[acetyl-CoA-carboxylase] ligase [Treponema sp.]
MQEQDTDGFNAGSFYAAFTEESARLGLDGPGILPADRVTLLDETDSTNTRLLSLLDGGGPLLDADGHLTDRGRGMSYRLVAAASQTAGRGRIGRRFWSPGGSGIYFSFAYVPEGGITDPGRLTAAAAVGVCRAADFLYGIRAGIKWVNDVYAGGRKVSGILTEGWAPATTEGSPALVQAAVVGIGVNIRAGSFLPEELSAKAGGIADEAVRLGCPPDRAASVTRTRLLASCMAHILGILTVGEDIRDEYASRSILTGREVTVIPLVGDERNRYRARVQGIGSGLELVVRTQDGEERLLSGGEVSLELGPAASGLPS